MLEQIQPHLNSIPLVIAPLIVALVVSVWYLGLFLYVHKEPPDLTKLFALCFAWLGVFSGVLLIWAVFNYHMMAILLKEYIHFAFFVCGLGMLLLSIGGVCSCMKKMQKDDSVSLRFRHIFSIAVVMTLIIVIIANISLENKEEKVAGAVQSFVDIEPTSGEETQLDANKLCDGYLQSCPKLR